MPRKHGAAHCRAVPNPTLSICPAELSQGSDSLTSTGTAPHLQVKLGCMGKWVRRQRLQDLKCMFPILAKPGLWALRMETGLRGTPTVPGLCFNASEDADDPHSQGFSKNQQRGEWGLTTPAGLGLDPDPLVRSAPPLSDVILATSSPASNPLLVIL